VVPVVTTAKRKLSGFGTVKMLLQQGRLILPREPELLKQLHALEYEQLQSGQTRIAVPERLGHDDLAMALMQAASTVHHWREWRPDNPRPNTSKVLETGTGTLIHEQPRAWNLPLALCGGRGKAGGDGW